MGNLIARNVEGHKSQMGEEEETLDQNSGRKGHSKKCLRHEYFCRVLGA